MTSTFEMSKVLHTLQKGSWGPGIRGRTVGGSRMGETSGTRVGDVLGDSESGAGGQGAPQRSMGHRVAVPIECNANFLEVFNSPSTAAKE